MQDVRSKVCEVLCVYIRECLYTNMLYMHETVCTQAMSYHEGHVAYPHRKTELRHQVVLHPSHILKTDGPFVLLYGVIECGVQPATTHTPREECAFKRLLRVCFVQNFIWDSGM